MGFKSIWIGAVVLCALSAISFAAVAADVPLGLFHASSMRGWALTTAVLMVIGALGRRASLAHGRPRGSAAALFGGPVAAYAFGHTGVWGVVLLAAVVLAACWGARDALFAR